LKMSSPMGHGFVMSQDANMYHQRRVQCEQTLIMNADDAEARGIEEGEPVRVFNERGEIEAVARIGSGDLVTRGVVVCPVGQWRKLNPGAATVNAITRTAFGDMGNNPTFSDTRVEVAPIEGS